MARVVRRSPPSRKVWSPPSTSRTILEEPHLARGRPHRTSQRVTSDFHDGIATTFGKNDTIDEGTGSELLGIVQTNSDVFGASVRGSILLANDW